MPDRTAGGAGRVRVVVGGQVPPPPSGQHRSVAHTLEHLQRDPRFTVRHAAYRFAEDMQGQGRLSVDKVVELFRVAWRLVAERRRGPIDLFLHPVSGPSTGAAVKDAVIVTVAGLLARRTVLQFHGAGHAEAWARPTVVHRILRHALGRADAAIVHASMHRRDPEHLGIRHVHVVPHRIPDRYDRSLRQAPRTDDDITVLYVGHLGPHRGTEELMAAVSRLRDELGGIRLDLVGDPSQGYGSEALARALDRAGPAAVTHHPSMTGRALDMRFAAADVFAFPSVFAAESFGLVLVEALMWGLPIVATDWRAAREVLAGDDLDVVLHGVEPSLGDAVTDALRRVVLALRDGSMPRMSETNRRAYELRYRDDALPLADVLLEVATTHAG